MSKCGGTWLRTVLPAVVKNSLQTASIPWQTWALSSGTQRHPLDNWRTELWHVHDRLTVVIDRVSWPMAARKAPGNFVTASMRNPFAWYWSYYNYLPNQPLSQVLPLLHLGGVPTNMSFQEWVSVLTLRTPGYMSYRFWTAYLAPPECYRVPYLNIHRTSVGNCTAARALRDLHEFQPASIMDFWLEHERLSESTAAALAAWDASAVDWELLRNLSHVSDEQSFLGGPTKDPRRHTDTNACSKQFAAQPLLRAQVMHADAQLFYKFNYSMC